MPKENKPEMVTIAARVEKQDVDDLARLAEMYGIKKSDAIREAVKAWVGYHKAPGGYDND